MVGWLSLVVLVLTSAPALATDCCQAHAYPGCDDWGIESCVCGQDSWCCETEWDAQCVAEVSQFGCGSCDAGPVCGNWSCEEGESCANCPSDCGSCTGDCCQPNGTPGCNNAGITSCVCAQDPFCCSDGWDEFCVAEVNEFGCGTCQTQAQCGNWSCEEGESCASCPQDCGACSGDCCQPNGTPGCNDPSITSCVCGMDSYCCENGWDETCVGEVTDFGCGSCGSTENCGNWSCDAGETCANCPSDCGSCTGDCCQPNGTPGCNDPSITSCVCGMDSFCCETGWDETCVAEVLDFGCGVCEGPAGCGDGSCGSGENCGNCPSDCGACTGDCCQPNGTPGCSDGAISACVCAMDSYCCLTEWDDVCVEEVSEFGCGQCGDEPAGCGNWYCEEGENCATCPSDCGACTGDCCQPNGTPGCKTAAIAECVCAQDDYCCTTDWDDMCVGEVTEFGCGQCASESCGDGICGWEESCVACPQDCGACSGDCCKGNGTPGCKDAAVSECVCAQDAFCCQSEWDSICAQEVTNFGCGECGGAAGCGDGQCGADESCDICPEDCGWCAGSGDCCEANNTPGCDDGSVQNCVCELDDYCCDVAWDFTCASEVESFGCGDCIGGTNCGDGICAPGETCGTCPGDCGPCTGSGSCCEPHEGPGCENATIQACVCKKDSFCCEYTWDDVCVEEVTSFGCGDCAGGGCGNGQCDNDEDCLVCPEDCGECLSESCCEPHKTLGCEDVDIAACVCNQDMYCCEVEWDSVCVDEVDSFGCGQCGGNQPQCGNGTCEGGETCKTCPQDCGPCGGQGDCCTPNDTPGCNNPSIQKCVCDKDVFCCETKWDEECVANVTALNCGQCGECIPDCMGLQCGSDGCGGSCGKCTPDKTCKDGQCVDAGGCVPNCEGKQCGPDGCGGTCGSCQPGFKCHSGQCKQEVCQPDCTGMTCGDDGCGGSCGTCPDGFFCQQGHCKKTCTPQCAGKQCGPDGCGGSCGNCPVNTFCDAQGHCASQCTPNCAGKQCGPDGCGGTCGQCPGDKVCTNGHCTSQCTPNCMGKQCGDDGCGGSCGQCPGDQVCNNQGHCVSNCTPSCVGKQCGSDGCGGSCGQCGFGEACNSSGHCQEVRVPNCLGKECGSDGCNGLCGNCGAGQVCTNAGLCKACTPDCEDKQCGDNGCEGSCGDCPDPLVCDENFTCVLESGMEEDVWEEDNFTPGDYPCQPGEVLQYGKCVPISSEEEDGDKSGGCATGGANPAALWLLLALGLMAVALRRASQQLSS